MKYNLTFLLAFFSIPLFAQSIPLPTIPPTKKVDSSDNYFGTIIQDPYRWLEDDNAADTKNWVIDENKITNDYLSAIPFRAQVKSDLQQMWNYEKFSAPFKEGNYTLFYKNDGLQNQNILYIQSSDSSPATVFIDPNVLSNAGTTSLGSVAFSKHQQYCAYSLHDAGSDWEDIYVMDMIHHEKIGTKITYAKNTSIDWQGDEGFYYSGYAPPTQESIKYSAKNQYQKIFYHAIGTSQSEDKVVFEDRDHPLRYASVSLTEDEHFLFLYISEGTDGSEIRYKDLTNSAMKTFEILIPGFSRNQYILDNIGNKLILVTNQEAANNKVVLVDPKQPSNKNWKTLIPEGKNKLESVSRIGDYLYCNYLKNACSSIDVYTINGVFLYPIALPGIGTASGFAGKKTDTITYYTFSSFDSPPTIYQYSIHSNKSQIYKTSTLHFPLHQTKVEQLWFSSKDGTQVPMFVFHREDVHLLDSIPHPTLMYGYGGFNIAKTPEFSVPTAYFVEQGGVYVMVSLRGGSEFGELWHKAGMLARKQNVFDDFISAAHYLIDRKITASAQLAINGRSNGGLLVGATMTQHPELFKVAIPTVGVLDMLRYQKFTIGWGWVVEYGSAEKKEEFSYLLKYSPLHNIKAGIAYPATLITTGDHDDRVVPAHSFKFAATLQAANLPLNPVLIRIDSQAGHGPGKPTSKLIDEWGDILSFTMYHLGMKVQK
jgi:prolyl oligopeptidase